MNDKFDTPMISAALFYPRKLDRTDLPEGARDLDVEVAPDVTIGCRFFEAAEQAPTILFFHGNGEIVADYDEIGPGYTQCGVNFLVADYRGYGWSDGSPSPKTMMADARVVFIGEAPGRDEKIKEVGNGQNLNTELILSLQPEAIIAFCGPANMSSIQVQLA